MNYYTATISVPLAEKLKEKGMPMGEGGKSMVDWKVPTYAEVFDWLMEQGISIEIPRHVDYTNLDVCPEWDWQVRRVGPLCDSPRHTDNNNTWHEAAEKAIEKALTLI